MEISLGENVAKNDLIIKKTLENINDKEEKIIEQYKKLKEFEPNCSSSMKSEFEKLLNERYLLLEFKLQSKEQQKQALYKLLEYLNILEQKEKKLHIQQTLDKMALLDNEITILYDLIRK